MKYFTKKFGTFIFLFFFTGFAQAVDGQNEKNRVNGVNESQSIQTTKEKIKVVAAQMLTDYDINNNLSKMLSYIKQAHQEGCEIVLFHEGCLSGYPNGKIIEKIDFSAIRKGEKTDKRHGEKPGHCRFCW